MPLLLSVADFAQQRCDRETFCQRVCPNIMIGTGRREDSYVDFLRVSLPYAVV